MSGLLWSDTIKKFGNIIKALTYGPPSPNFFRDIPPAYAFHTCYAIQLGKFRYAVYTVRVTQLRILYHSHVCRLVNLIWRSLRRGVPSRDAYRSRFLNHSHFWLYFLKKYGAQYRLISRCHTCHFNRRHHFLISITHRPSIIKTPSVAP